MINSNQKGYALVIVLAFIMVASILSMPYIHTFLQDTTEMQIESSKNKNDYILESAVDITKAIVEANNLQDEEKLVSVMDILQENSLDLFQKKIKAAVDTSNNALFFETDGREYSSRSKSTLTIIYKTFDSEIFGKKRIVIRGNKKKPLEEIKGNNHFKESYLNRDVIGLSEGVYDDLVQQLFIDFSSSFIGTKLSTVSTKHEKNEDKENKKDKENEEDEEDPFSLGTIYNSLWIEGDAVIKGQGNNSSLYVNGDMFVGGNLDLSNLDRVVVGGDLVVYGSGSSLDINNVDTILVGGNMIVKGDVKITGNPLIQSTNISAATIHINIGNRTEVFPPSDESDEPPAEIPENPWNDGEDDEVIGSPEDTANEYIDGQMIFDSWKLE